MLYASFKIYCAESKINKGERGIFASMDIETDTIIERSPVAIIKGEEIYLGFGMLYQHSKEPNAICEKFPDERLVKFISIKDIKKDEEITI